MGGEKRVALHPRCRLTAFACHTHTQTRKTHFLLRFLFEPHILARMKRDPSFSEAAAHHTAAGHGAATGPGREERVGCEGTALICWQAGLARLAAAGTSQQIEPEQPGLPQRARPGRAPKEQRIAVFGAPASSRPAPGQPPPDPAASKGGPRTNGRP